MSSRMRKLNTRFSVLILLVPLLCNLVLFSQVAYAEAKNALISNLPAKIENGLLDAIEDTGQVSLPDVIGAGKDNPTLMGADVKIMDRFFRHRELPDSENFSKPGFHLKTA
ncbi:hypothetical protein HAU38_10545 [Weissella confusa]|uniref:hypothetical protein n=1 Tax=Weissella confusa TaxID=1583 RepID=UPI0018F1C6EA|nr:hypothetical protein [Weissella confusa]MBJ7676529.1 hypothetical protein [Weissella confusa]